MRLSRPVVTCECAEWGLAKSAISRSALEIPYFSRMKRIIISVFLLVFLATNTGIAQKKLWAGRMMATREYMQKHLWNAATGNFVRRADMPNAPGSDAWGITIVLDAYAYMVEDGLMKPDELKQYYVSSSALYEKTNGSHGARILGRQGSQIYVGGDDDLQWCSALVHCYTATKDTSYLLAARWVFNDLVALNFWIRPAADNLEDGLSHGRSKGWAWNSGDMRPNGVSTAYGALATARLYQATSDMPFKGWATSSLDALKTPQVGFFPRDMMVAANAALTVYEVSHDDAFLVRAESLARTVGVQVKEILSGKRKGELNPTDVGDLAEGLFRLASITHNKSYLSSANQLLNFFVNHRTNRDIAQNGFFSRYDTKGKPDLNGSYLGVPLNVPFLPEVAEMLKLFALAYRFD
jgi:hypothetical protein